jgi:DNA repair exonuclease SbcCD ATPase subunit
MPTKEQILKAADDLDAAGHAPTLAAVRKAVGGGSFTTIQQAMTEWKARKAHATKPAIQAPAPAEIAERLAAVGADLWAAALSLADGRLAAEREALEQVRTEAEAASKEAADLADALSAELDQARAAWAAEREDLAKAEAEARRECEAVRASLEKEREKTAEAIQAAAKMAGRLEAVEAQNAALLGKLAAPAPVPEKKTAPKT